MTDDELIARARNWQSEMERSSRALFEMSPDMEEAARGNEQVAETLGALATRLTTLLAERDAALVAELGVGKRVVNWGMYAGNPAVFIEPLPDGKPGIEGEFVPDELQGPKDSLLPGAIILSFPEYPNTFLDCLRKALNYEDALAAALVEGARLRLALTRIAKPHITPDHMWSRDCDACGREEIARAALSSIKGQADASD